MKRLLSILIATTLLFVGCGGSGGGSFTEKNFTETTATLYIHGKKVPLPCTLSSLDSGFSIKTYETSPTYNHTLFYNDEKVADIKLRDYKPGDNTSEKEIITIYLSPIEKFPFSLNGLEWNSSPRTVIEKLGKPSSFIGDEPNDMTMSGIWTYGKQTNIYSEGDRGLILGTSTDYILIIFNNGFMDTIEIHCKS